MEPSAEPRSGAIQVTKQSADVNVENSPGATVIVHNNADQGQGQGGDYNGP